MTHTTDGDLKMPSKKPSNKNSEKKATQARVMFREVTLEQMDTPAPRGMHYEYDPSSSTAGRRFLVPNGYRVELCRFREIHAEGSETCDECAAPVPGFRACVGEYGWRNYQRVPREWWDDSAAKS